MSGSVTHSAETQFCPKPGCPHRVIVAVCRGIKNPENRGYFYERCDAPGPYSHWLRWRKEIHRLGEEEVKDARYSGPIPTTMQEALQLPCTPSNIPIFSPSKTPSFTQEIASSPIKAPPQSVASTPFPGSGHVLGKCSSPSVPVAATSSEANISSTLYDRSHTRTVVVKGKATVACNGPICRENGKPPVRIAQLCINHFCQKCCIQFQGLGGPKCVMPTHNPESKQPRSSIKDLGAGTHSGSTSTASAPDTSQLVSETPVKAVSNASGTRLIGSPAGPSVTGHVYNAKRVMDDNHYLARQTAREAWQKEAGHLVQQQAKAELLKTTINIIFWKDNDEEPEFITIPCPSYPTFTISESSLVVRSLLGIGEDMDMFISTFDPVASRWASHTALTPRDISQHRTLLYRASGVKSNAVDMKKNVDQVIQFHLRCTGSKKRPTTATDFAATSNSKRPRLESITPKLEALVASNSVASRSITVSDTSSDESDEEAVILTKPIVKRECSDDVVVISQKKKANCITATKNLKLDDGDLAVMSSSAHAKWPLKYVKAMADGFARMESMDTTDRERFLCAFGDVEGIKFPSKPTYYENYGIWNAAPNKLKRRYIQAGYTDQGLWKTFSRHVRGLYPGGKIPRLERRGGKAKSAKGKKKEDELDEDNDLESDTADTEVFVKTEREEIAIAVDYEEGEVIEIFSDDE